MRSKELIWLFAVIKTVKYHRINFSYWNNYHLFNMTTRILSSDARITMVAQWWMYMFTNTPVQPQEAERMSPISMTEPNPWKWKGWKKDYMEVTGQRASSHCDATHVKAWSFTPLSWQYLLMNLIFVLLKIFAVICFYFEILLSLFFLNAHK